MLPFYRRRFAVCATALALLAACSHRAEPHALPTPQPVGIVQVHSGSLDPSIVAAGLIIPFLQVGVASPLSEPITEVDVRPGMSVRRGDVLARIDTSDLLAQKSAALGIIAEDRSRLAQTEYVANGTLAQASGSVDNALAALRQAQATLAGAERDARRESSLAAQGYLAEQLLQQQQTVVAADRQSVVSAQATLRSARITAAATGAADRRGAQQAQVAAAREALAAAIASARQIDRQIERATLVAPIGGVVEAVNANPGEYPAGRELFTIEEIDRVYAALPTSNRQAASIRRGDAASVTISGETARRRGTVDAVLDQITPGTTSFIVRVLIENADGRLRPGMAVQSVVSPARVRGVRIPLTAFVDDEHRAVLVVDSSRTAHRTAVVTLATQGSAAIVDGIPDGARIVADAESAGVESGDRIGR